MDIKFDITGYDSFTLPLPQVFITSDLHFCHERVMCFCPSTRPYEDVDEMNAHLVKSINDVLDSPEKLLIHAGDFVVGGGYSDVENIIYRLNFPERIIFVRGNHDTRQKCSALASYVVCDMIHFRVGSRKEGKEGYISHFPLLEWAGCEKGHVSLHGHTHGSMNEKNEKRNAHDVGWDANQAKILSFEEALTLADKGININRIGKS